MKQAVFLVAALLLAGCGDNKAKSDAGTVVATLNGDDKGAAGDNPQCRMFSRDEVAALAGEPVKAGTNAASGLGCQWLASDGSGSTIVSVAPADNYVETSEAEGFHPLTGVGTKGFAAGKPGGWTAAAVTGDKTVFVSIDSDKTSEAKVIALLKQTLAKVQG